MILKRNLKLTLDYVVKLLSLVNGQGYRIILLFLNIRSSHIESFGKLVSEAIAKMLIFKAGAALYIGGKADSIAQGISLAAELIDSKKAMEVLQKLVEVSNRAEGEA